MSSVGLIEPALRGILLYARFAQRGGVLRPGGRAPREVPRSVTHWYLVAPGDLELLIMYDCESVLDLRKIGVRVG